jgi:hypothetical protein
VQQHQYLKEVEIRFGSSIDVNSTGTKSRIFVFKQPTCRSSLVYRRPAGFGLAGEGETGTEAIDMLGGASSIISVSPSSNA